MNFVKINNILFNEIERGTGVTTIHKIGCEGFVLYTKIVELRNIQGQTIMTLNMIKNYLQGVRGFATTRAIRDKLAILQVNKLIKIENNQQNIKNNDLLIITTHNIEQYQSMPLELMNNNLKAIGSIGFTLLCYLVKLHNNNKGYADPSQLLISSALGVGRNAIIKYINVLESEKLIRTQTEDVFLIDDKFGIPTLNRPNTKYKVNYLTSKKDKYYLPKPN